jgi:O-antigen ligase
MNIFALDKDNGLVASLFPISLAVSLLFFMVSISLTQIFLSVSLILWVILLVQKKLKICFPSFFWPLLVYVALSLVSAFFSVNLEISLKDSKELFLYLLVPIAYGAFIHTRDIARANLALLISGCLDSFYALGQFVFKTSAEERIKGFMGHYMTQAGILLLFSLFALSQFLFSKDKWKYLWGAGALLALLALIVTLTRSAWVGFAVAVLVILFLYKPKTLIIIPVLSVFIFFLSPQAIRSRALSIFSLKSFSNRLRVEYLRAGIKIIKDYPILGTGPDTVDLVFQDPKYGLSEEAKKNVHLHNNFTQIAAERGIPTLLVWVIFQVWTFIMLLKLLKNKEPSLFSLTTAALAAILALITAGLFEYNFGDSEITTLFLYLITIPFASFRIQEKAKEKLV